MKFVGNYNGKELKTPTGALTSQPSQFFQFGGGKASTVEYTKEDHHEEIKSPLTADRQEN